MMSGQEFKEFQVVGIPEYIVTLGQAHDAAERHNRHWGANQQSVHSLALDVSTVSGALAEAANDFESTCDPRDAADLLNKSVEMAGVALAVATRMRRVLVKGGPV